VLWDGKVIAVLAVRWDRRLPSLSDRCARAVRLLADEAAVALEHDALLDRYEALAGTDQLTGLPNRRAWDQRLTTLILGAERTGEGFVVAVVDVDHFKAYNDAYGHVEGDVLLREIAQAARDELRAVDLVARWGGEEFAIALPAEDDARARAVLERVRAAVPQGQSVSIGYAHWSDGESAESLMKAADAALYEAKRTGRNRVIAAARSRRGP
jgi:diguanylate cyclase (GGDEF)-like protein